MEIITILSEVIMYVAAITLTVAVLSYFAFRFREKKYGKRPSAPNPLTNPELFNLVPAVAAPVHTNTETLSYGHTPAQPAPAIIALFPEQRNLETSIPMAANGTSFMPSRTNVAAPVMSQSIVDQTFSNNGIHDRLPANGFDNGAMQTKSFLPNNNGFNGQTIGLGNSRMIGRKEDYAPDFTKPEPSAPAAYSPQELALTSAQTAFLKSYTNYTSNGHEEEVILQETNHSSMRPRFFNLPKTNRSQDELTTSDPNSAWR